MSRVVNCAVLIASWGLLSASVRPVWSAEIEAKWKTAANGVWSDGSRWTTDPVAPNNGVPAADISYRAIVDAQGAPYEVLLLTPVTLSELQLASPDVTLLMASLPSTIANITISQGDLVYAGDRLEANHIRLDGGRFSLNTNSVLANARIDGNAEAFHSYWGLLENVTFATSPTRESRLAVSGTLMIDTPELTVAGGLVFFNSGSLSGTGRVVFPNGGSVSGSGDVVIDTNVDLEIQPSLDNSSFNVLSGVRMTNRGTITNGRRFDAGVPLPDLTIVANEFVNEGRLNLNGKTQIGIDSSTRFRNPGEVVVGPDSQVMLHASFASEDLLRIQLSPTSTLGVTGVLLNQDVTLDLTSPDWAAIVQGSQYGFAPTIAGGRLISSAQVAIRASEGGVTLRDVTVVGELRSEGVLTAVGSVDLEGATVSANELRWDGSPWSGAGRLQANTVTADEVGPSVDLEVTGGLSTIQTNRGTIHTRFGSDLRLGENQGLLNVNDGFVLVESSNGGQIRQAGGTIQFHGNIAPWNWGDVQRSGGGIVLGGSIDNRGHVLELDDNLLFSGQLRGGTVQNRLGERSMLMGSMTEHTTLRGTLRVANLSAETLELNDATLDVEGSMTFDQLLGAGTVRLSYLGKLQGQANWSLPAGMTIENQDDHYQGFLENFQVNFGTIDVVHGTLSADQMANNGLVRIHTQARLLVSQPTNASLLTGGRWELGPGAQLAASSDLAFHAQDQMAIDLGMAAGTAVPVSTLASVTLNGQLAITAHPHAVMRTDRVLKLISAASYQGDFASVALPELPAAFQWDTSQLATEGLLHVLGPAPSVRSLTQFLEPDLGASGFTPSANATEVGFQTESQNRGLNPRVAVAVDTGSETRFLEHRSVLATTTFAPIDVTDLRGVELDVNYSILKTTYEQDDFFRLYAQRDGEQLDLLTLSGRALTNAPAGLQSVRLPMPEDWTQFSLVLQSSSNSGQAAEGYRLYSLLASGYGVDLVGYARGDLNQDRQIDVADVLALQEAILDGAFDAKFDLNDDRSVDADDLQYWVFELKQTTIGDANGDRRFDSQDFVQIFQAGEYEDGLVRNSRWDTGDWSGDGEFDSYDLVLAFQQGGYEAELGAANVPEPQWPSCMLLFGLLGRRRLRVMRSIKRDTAGRVQRGRYGAPPACATKRTWACFQGNSAKC